MLLGTSLIAAGLLAVGVVAAADDGPWIERVAPKAPPPAPLACLPGAPLILAARCRDADCTNCLEWRRSEVEQDGRKRASIFYHPPAKGDGDATFRLKLPAPGAGRRVVLRFAAALSGPTTNGAASASSWTATTPGAPISASWLP